MYQPFDLIARNAAMYPERIAVISNDVAYTYRYLHEQSNAVACALQDKGIGKGDAVTFILGNSEAFVILFWGLMKLGAVAVPLNKRLNSDDVAYMMDCVSAKAMFVDADALDKTLVAIDAIGFAGLLVVYGDQACDAAAGWNDFAASGQGQTHPLEGYTTESDHTVITFTSGTTSKAKPVVRDVAGLNAMIVAQTIEGHSFEKGVEVLYTQAPLFHLGGFGAMLKITAMGGTLALARHFEPARIFELIEHCGVTQLYMIPPSLFARLAEHDSRQGRVYPGVREVQCAGGRTTDRDRKAIFDLFPNTNVRTSFGSSETGMPVSAHFNTRQLKEHPSRSATCGLLNPFVTLRLVDEQGRDVPQGTPGEAIVKSPMNFREYLGMPAETAKALDGEGFFHTGDMLYQDAEGYYVFADRIKDMIKTGGENVFSIEVEKIILRYPGIKECSVVGLEDDLFGEAVAAAIVLASDAAATFSKADFLDYCKKHMASFKKPRYLAILDSIPRNSLGKPQKRELRARRKDFEPLS